MYYLNFENNICEMDKKLAQPDLSENEKKRLQTKLNRLIENTYKRLTPWQKTLVARHENRPHTFDYIRFLIKDFTPLAGDRLFGEDSAPYYQKINSFETISFFNKHKKVIKLDKSQPIFDAYKLVSENNAKQIQICENGKVIKNLTKKDVLSSILNFPIDTTLEKLC